MYLPPEGEPVLRPLIQSQTAPDAAQTPWASEALHPVEEGQGPGVSAPQGSGQGEALGEALAPTAGPGRLDASQVLSGSAECVA